MLQEIDVQCPQCGETVTITVDTSEENYSTVEDCSVCCRPMAIEIRLNSGQIEHISVNPA